MVTLMGAEKMQLFIDVVVVLTVKHEPANVFFELYHCVSFK